MAKHFMRIAILLSFATGVLLCCVAHGQGICVHETLVVSRVSGRVVAQLNTGETPLYDITVKVLGPNGRVVASAVTGKDGLFNVDRAVKPGKYVLDVSYKRLLATYTGALVVKRSRRNVPPKEIVVTLGADFVRPCGGTHVELR